MIEGYEDIVREWAPPSLMHGCCDTVTISPSEDMRRWAVQQTVTILANADYYYTKVEVDNLLREVTGGDITREEVQAMIDRSLSQKADQAELEKVKQQVADNTARIFNTYNKTEVNNLLKDYYTKLETRGMFQNYSKVNDTTLLLNAEGITT